MLPARLPTYRELLARTDAPPGTAWGIFGDDDQLGTLNLLTPERAKASAAEVQTGEVFSLNWNVELPDPAPFRQVPVRHQVGAGSVGRDDWMDKFYLQGSSQWDGLRHIAHPRYGFYNGVDAARVDDPASDTLGIHVVGGAASSGAACSSTSRDMRRRPVGPSPRTSPSPSTPTSSIASRRPKT